MPKFEKTSVYEEREELEKDDTPKAVVGQSPKLSQLMAMKDDGTFVPVMVPLITPDNIRYDPICLNNETFFPGRTYLLHPIIAKELYTSIRQHSNAITRQKSSRLVESDNLLTQVKKQEEAERKMFEQFASLGMSVQA